MTDYAALKPFLRDELTPSNNPRGSFICPFCGSGSHGAGSNAALMVKEGDTGLFWNCFSCHRHGDIVDLVMERDGISKAEAVKKLTAKYLHGGQQPAPKTQPTPNPPKSSLQAKDIKAAIERFHAAMPGSEGEAYLKGRGLTVETIARFNLGYDAQSRVVTLPYNQQGTYYGKRTIDEGAHIKHQNLNGVPVPLFNPMAMYSGNPCFVVESPICAMSITQEGGTAIALAGTSGKKRLLEQVEKQSPSGKLILSLDNDESGQKAQQEIAEALDKLGIPFLQANIAGDAKDPNEALQRGTLKQGIEAALQAVEAAQNAQEANKEKASEDYQQQTAAGYMAQFLTDIQDRKKHETIATGFRELDKQLDGGLYAGLYVLGAITSLGKTTLVLQMADYMAAQGQDVLYFSLEMARSELIAKSLSRLTFKRAEKKNKRDIAKTTRGILRGNWNYSIDEIENTTEAIDEYQKTIAGHIWMYEGIGNIGVTQIREAVDRHIHFTGRSPVVIIDYLQILAPVDIRATDKQNTDRNVLELKRLSRDKGIPVFGISSLNRDNYTQPINNAAFKESGAIEYSTDVLIGLQFLGMDYVEGETDKNREKRVRDLIKQETAKGAAGKAERIQIKVLKNRNGTKGESELLYIPMFNCYQDIPEGSSVATEESDASWEEQSGKKKRL